MMISIIIPVYNEEVMLRKNAACYSLLSQSTELIFVDGGSEDKTAELAKASGRLVKARKNRAAQMNAGARTAKGEILLFLHADAVIQQMYLEKIEEAVEKQEYAGGCLTQVIDEQRILFKWISFTGNIRAKMSKIFYGDQGIFVRKGIFEKLGGFPEVKICEDILFTKKLKKEGKVDILPVPVYCSARRWKKQGIVKTSLLNFQITTALALGRHPDRLSIVYKDVRG